MLNDVADQWENIYQFNVKQIKRFSDIIINLINKIELNNINKNTINISYNGLAFKGETNDVRDSPSLQVLS